MDAKHTPVVLAGYEITRDGRIYSTTNWRGLGRRELAQHPNDDGYPSVRVTLSGKRVRYAVHALVASAYLPPRPTPRHEVRHLDGNKPLDLPRLVALAKAADLVRGYGHIKEGNVARYRTECARLERAIGQPLAQAAE